MSKERVLPEDVCTSLAQLVERAVAEASTDALFNSRLSALRSCFDDAISRVRAARQAKKLVTVPDDIWPLVFAHLPFDDLLSTSRTCRIWRALALANSRLWTRLVLHVYDRTSSPCSTNIGALKRILPRSHCRPLELEVRIAAERTGRGSSAVIGEFLELVAPRLTRLTLASDIPWRVGIVLEYLCTFPELRELVVPPPSRGRSESKDGCCVVTLAGRDAPKIVELDLRPELWVTCVGAWPQLRSVRCTCEGLEQIEELLLSARNLQRLVLDWTCEPDGRASAPLPSTALLAALRAVPDVDVTAELAPAFEAAVFHIFGNSPAPRLRLAFNIWEGYDGPFKPQPCSRLSAAVHLTISVRGGDTVIVPDGGSDREALISLQAVPQTYTLPPAIDWEMIPSLEALEHLSVDAALCLAFMHNFPSCPRLAEITLTIRAVGDIQAVLATPALPRAESLNLISGPTVEVLAGQVDALKTALGASHVALNRVTTAC